MGAQLQGVGVVGDDVPEASTNQGAATAAAAASSIQKARRCAQFSAGQVVGEVAQHLSRFSTDCPSGRCAPIRMRACFGVLQSLAQRSEAGNSGSGDQGIASSGTGHRSGSSGRHNQQQQLLEEVLTGPLATRLAAWSAAASAQLVGQLREACGAAAAGQ
uniref:Uncharacterized protein n=1 Tax=Chlamydomonas leiostraca TaxID=1034604 RepID=A0A7S0RGW6_9CHLO